MARVGRIAGALLAETRGQWFLVGNTKKPCDWSRAGFEPPPEIDASKRPFAALAPCGEPKMAGTWLAMDVEGEELARVVARRFVIERNGSVSERLWNLVTCEQEGEVDARWLGQVPERVWDVVRDSVLRCL